jgi:hypothetical protein
MIIVLAGFTILISVLAVHVGAWVLGRRETQRLLRVTAPADAPIPLREPARRALVPADRAAA